MLKSKKKPQEKFPCFIACWILSSYVSTLCSKHFSFLPSTIKVFLPDIYCIVLILPCMPLRVKVSKTILDKINTEIREQTRAKQWQNSEHTIAWLNSIHNKNRHTFVSFHVVNVYLSISEDLLDRAIAWGKQFTLISQKS